MPLEMTFNRILIKVDDPETVTASGIHLPHAARRQLNRGVVRAVGPGTQNEAGNYIPVGIEKGDTVWFSAHQGQEVEDEGESLLIIGEQAVLAIELEAEPEFDSHESNLSLAT